MPRSIKFSRIKCIQYLRSPVLSAVVYHKCMSKEDYIKRENFKTASSEGAGTVWVGDKEISAYISS